MSLRFSPGGGLAEADRVALEAVSWTAEPSAEHDESVTLLADLNAFFTEHRQCGELEAGVDGPIVWFACDCGARMTRRVDAADDSGRD